MRHDNKSIKHGIPTRFVSWKNVFYYISSSILKGQSRENQRGLYMFIFPRRQQQDHLFGCETHANRAITTQSWDYLMYLHDLAVHTDQLPHHRKTSQPAKQLCNYDVI